jgi:hypothetical protein
VGSAARAAEFPGDTLFDDVKKFEANGEELGSFTFSSGGDFFREWFSFLPRDKRAESSIKREGLGQHGRSFGQAFIEFAKSLREISVILNIVRHPT